MSISWLAKTIQRYVYKLLDNFELLVQENTVLVSNSSIEKKLFISNIATAYPWLYNSGVSRSWSQKLLSAVTYLNSF